MEIKILLDADHNYTVDGVPHPGVSTILNIYFPPSEFYTEAGKEKGTIRHSWYNFLAQGLTPGEKPDPRIAGEMEQFRKWLVLVQPCRLGGEKPFAVKGLVCGTPDWYGEIAGRLSVVDFKPKTRNKRTQVQTAAYQYILKKNNIMILDRYELRLSPTTFRLEKHKDINDVRRWEAMMYGFFAAEFYR